MQVPRGGSTSGRSFYPGGLVKPGSKEIIQLEGSEGNSDGAPVFLGEDQGTAYSDLV